MIAAVTIRIVTTVDARGLACPLPLTMAKRAMASLPPGSVLVVLSTDREAPIDLAAWALAEGHSYSEAALEGWVEHRLGKGAGSGANSV
jgi:tRNA 2-thiouridine synthesizing protein A